MAKVCVFAVAMQSSDELAGIEICPTVAAPIVGVERVSLLMI